MELLKDYDFVLPTELIAKEPAQHRGSSRLLALPWPHKAVKHDSFQNIEQYLKPGDALVLNNTRVIKARLFGKKTTGGRIEILVVRPMRNDEWLVLLKGSGPFRPGLTISLDDSNHVIKLIAPSENEPMGFIISSTTDLFSHCESHGEMPLPAYLGRAAGKEDEHRYQTVYAKDHRLKAVAAPTAGLHFTKELLASIKYQGVAVVECTLSVGPGTFLPIRNEHIDDHRMHFERFELDEMAAMKLNDVRKSGGRIIAVGTTSMRVLEHIAGKYGEFKPSVEDTNIFIRPGYKFKACDGLITNFHVPRTTLFLLVCAILGREKALQVYEEAIALRYRFFSYGDACFFGIDRKAQNIPFQDGNQSQPSPLQAGRIIDNKVMT